VLGLRSGRLSLSETCQRYQLSVEELSGWGDAFDQEGILGVRASALASRGRRRQAD
jgi:hypothetical protein